MPRSVYLILITLFMPFQSHPPPFPEDLILLVFSTYPSFLLNYTCLLAFAIFPWPSFSPKLSSHCSFPFTTQFLESVLCAPCLQFSPSFLSVTVCMLTSAFAYWPFTSVIVWSPSNNASLWHLTPFHLSPHGFLCTMLFWFLSSLPWHTCFFLSLDFFFTLLSLKVLIHFQS